MSTQPYPNTDPEPSPTGDGDTAQHVQRGLAELAFGSLSRIDEFSQGRHLALLHTESLELDLSDPTQRNFGDYELLEMIGEGGMGVVYRARQISLDREVAIKLLAAGPWASREFIDRFLREAQNAARMQHPNIVAIHEVGSSEELHFFSMRLVRGQSLADALRKSGLFEAPRAARLMRTVAEALAYAHSLGVLHLDLKPANVLLDEDGAPHVADFGLARRLGSAMAVDNEEISGTPAYMAPEQVQARIHKLSAATDIWGLGAILHELVTGVPPFQAESAQATLTLVLEGRVRRPRRSQPRLPLDLEAVILKCLDKNPPARYASARELADDLARFIEHRAVRARPLNAAQRLARWVRREPGLAIVGALCIAALLIGLAATTQQWRRAEGNAARAGRNAALAETTLWKSRDASMQASISAGDSFHALRYAVTNLREMQARGATHDAALARLRIGTILANAPRLIDTITLGAPANAMAMSPDDTSLAVATDRVVRLIDIKSGAERWRVDTRGKSSTTYASGAAIWALRFSEDGKRLLALAPGTEQMLRLYNFDTVLIDAEHGRMVDPPQAFVDYLGSSYSDDGRYALLADKRNRIQRWHTQPWVPAGRLVQFSGRLSDGVIDALMPPGGNVVLAASDDFFRFWLLDPKTLKPRHTLQLNYAQGRGTAWTLSHDGRHAAIGTQLGKIVVIDLGDGHVHPMDSATVGWIERLEFSRDDTRLFATSDHPTLWQTFDPAIGELLARPLMFPHSILSRVIAGSRVDEFALRVAVGDPPGSWLMRMPASGFPLMPPAHTAPLLHNTACGTAASTDPAARLLMSCGADGALGMWRLPQSNLLDAKGAPLVADMMRFDGAHRVRVDGRRVSVEDANTGATLGTPIMLAQPPTFAELTADGSTLVTIAGVEIRAWDWKTGAARWPALALPNSPIRVSVAAKAPVLAVATGNADAHGFREDVQIVDLASGRRVGQPIALRGPLQALRLSADGRRLLAWREAHLEASDVNTLHVIDTISAKVILSLLHKGHHLGVTDAQFDDHGGIWSAADDGDSVRIVSHWNADGVLLRATPVPVSAALAPLPGGQGAIVVGNAVGPYLGPIRVDADGGTHPLPAPIETLSITPIIVIDAHGRLFATAKKTGVSVIDLVQNERLLPDFELPLPNNDSVQQLAFSPDGTRLVGRTLSGHYLQWKVVPDTRALDEIEGNLSLLDPRDNLSGVATPLSPAEHAHLRMRDPGPRTAQIARPVAITTPAASANRVDGRYVTLDLSPIANVDPRQAMNRGLFNILQSLPGLPSGLQRYDGIDFLLGRAVQLTGIAHNPLNVAFPMASATLPVPSSVRHSAAFDLLLVEYFWGSSGVGGGSNAERAAHPPVAHMVLHYADGGTRSLPIRYGVDTIEYYDYATPDLAQPRIGWLGNYSGSVGDFGMTGEATPLKSFLVHLENPQPARLLSSISLSTPEGTIAEPLFLAITAEPSDAALVKRQAP